MTEETQNNPAAAAEEKKAPKAQISLQKMFVKDISFEAPNSPQIFQQQSQLEVQLNIGQQARPMENNDYEVLITVTVTAKAGEQTAYLVEVQQGGVFHIEGLEQAQTHGALGAYCPSVLFPYARQIISDLVGNGGFPPLLLQHMNFDAMYADQMRRQQEEAAKNEQAK